MIKGFVFDLDGVLTDTATFHYQAWKQLAATLGITIDLAFNEQLKGISRMDSLEHILQFGQLATTYSSQQKKQLAYQKNEHYRQLLNQLTPNDLLAGVHSFLAEAQQQQILCALASASQNAPFILEKLGIQQYFQAIVNPACLTHGKPDPEIFYKAAAALHLSPHELIGFEDAQAGIDGIKAAGMYAVGVSITPLIGADLQVQRLNQLTIAQLLTFNSGA